MKKQISALLLMAMLASLAACGGDAPAADTTAADTAGETATDPSVETELTDDLPEKDYGGAEINLLVRTERMYYLSTEETGDVFDDAVFARNRAVEERFNVKLKYNDLVSDRGIFVGAVQTSVMAEDEGFDIMIPDYWWGVDVPDYMLNLNELEYLDFEKPWWSASWNDASNIANGFYSCVGYYCLDLLRNVNVTYFNKSLIESYKLENPYELVKNGQWTMDKVLEMGSKVARDLNGDTNFDENDAYGWYMNGHAVMGLYHAMGSKHIVRDGDTLMIKDLDEDYIRINDYIYNLKENNTGALYRIDTTVDFTTTLAYKPFNQNNLLFTFFALTAVEAMRQTDVNFGIVPCPTLEEGDPIRVHNYGCSVSAIPLNTPDPERSSIILEALNYQSWKDTVPVYYEQVLKGKLARDTESEEMLDLIFENITFDTAHIYGGQIGFTGLNDGSSPNPASAFAAGKQLYEENLKALIERYTVE